MTLGAESSLELLEWSLRNDHSCGWSLRNDHSCGCGLRDELGSRESTRWVVETQVWTGNLRNWPSCSIAPRR